MKFHRTCLCQVRTINVVSNFFCLVLPLGKQTFLLWHFFRLLSVVWDFIFFKIMLLPIMMKTDIISRILMVHIFHKNQKCSRFFTFIVHAQLILQLNLSELILGYTRNILVSSCECLSACRTCEFKHLSKPVKAVRPEVIRLRYVSLHF